MRQNISVIFCLIALGLLFCLSLFTTVRAESEAAEQGGYPAIEEEELRDDLPLNGHGSFTYSTGDHYEGEWKDGQQHGNGIVTYSTSDKYQGTWEGHKMVGDGVYTMKSGTVYKGTWKDGKIVLKDILGKENDWTWEQ